MEDLPAQLRSFLQNHPFFELTDFKKIKCTLNGHELPCSLAELQHFTSGRKYKQLSAEAQFDYSQYEPHIVASTKQANRLFCKLTLRHINRVPQHVLRHISGRRYKKALEKYEECVRQGVEFVPLSLQKKKRAADCDDVTGSDSRRKKKDDSGIYDPGSSDDEKSDSDDSMSDLYPSSLFTLKKTEDEGMKDDGEDDFESDDDDEETEMEVENQTPKRRKAQSAVFTKKFKRNKKRKGFRNVGKVNGK